jgi:hypothetical protein
MIGRFLDELPRDAILRIVRTREAEWHATADLTVRGQRSLAGVIMDVEWDFDLRPVQRGPDVPDKVRDRWHRLAERYGTMAAGELVQRAAKRRLGSGVVNGY